MREFKKKIFSTTPGVVGKVMAAMLCMIMVGVFLVVGCKKDNEKKTPVEPEYPIEIPFTEYSLSGTSCQWVNLNYDETVIIINSIEELENYIVCEGGGYPEVDFDKQTLLLASGETEKGILKTTAKKNLQLSSKKYELNVVILLNDTPVVEKWRLALIVKKVMEESHVELSVDYKELEYIPMLIHGNQWNELVANYTISPQYQYERTHITKIGNDTLIDGVSYYKLLTTKDELSSIWLNNGYVREDTKNRKVYYKPDNHPEILLYDFNAHVGDEIQSYDIQFEVDAFIKVESVNYVLMGGKLRKQINVISKNHPSYLDGTDHTWIEGIGNMDGFLKSTAVHCGGCDLISLLCFFQNGELIYKPESIYFEDCFVWKNPND